MKKGIIVLLLLITGSVWAGNRQKNENQKDSDYVVLASEAVRADSGWRGVVETLQALHAAEVLFYSVSPEETLEELRRLSPRYVAVVEKPEKINIEFVIGMHTLSRKVTPGIFAGFIWGMITGVDAEAALNLVKRSTHPLMLRNGMVSQEKFVELKDGNWDKFACVSLGHSGFKGGEQDTLTIERWKTNRQFEYFDRLYHESDPDLLLSESYAPVYQFGLPDNGSVRERIEARNGQFHYTASEAKFQGRRVVERDTLHKDVDWSGGTKVYIACGSWGCDVDRPEVSTALAWMKSANVTAMVGYPRTQLWGGPAAWGGLKFWKTLPGRYTMAEAYFLNQQHMLYTLNKFSPRLIEEAYDQNWNASRDLSKIKESFKALTGKEIPGTYLLGCWQERDILAYFGDPKWDVRFRPEEASYTVKAVRKGKKYIVTLITKENFYPEDLDGNFFRMYSDDFLSAPTSIGKIPFSFIFPERLKNPRLAPGQEWKVGLSGDMLLVYDEWFEPGKTYKFVLLTEDR